MRLKSSRFGRDIALMLTGALLAALFISPAGAHVGGTVTHLWSKHLLPLAKKAFYTKSQSNAKYLGKTAKAADADKLDGQDSTAFAAAASPWDLIGQTPADMTSLDVGVFNNGSYSSTSTGPLSDCYWHNLDSEHSPAGYQVDGDGMVNLIGVVKAEQGNSFSCTTGDVADREIFKLPPEAAPDKRVVLATVANNDPVRISVETSGIVTIEDNTAMFDDALLGWLSLDGLQFPADLPT